MSVQPPYTPPSGAWKEGFFRRLGIYLVSVAIGFLLLALMQMMKKANTQNATPPKVPVQTSPAK